MANTCIDCDSPESTPSQEILYSQEPTSPTRLRRHTRLADPVSGYALYPCDDDYQTGFYLVLPQAANNLVPNPTFATGLDSWSTFNSSIIRTNDIAFDSGFSLRINGSGDTVTVERRAYVETEITSFLPGQPYTFTMYGWTPVIWDTVDPALLTISIADDLGNEIFSEPLTKTRTWQRLIVSTVVDAAATSLFLRVNLRSQDQREIQPPNDLTGEFNLANEHAYFDMAQFEFGTEATTPFHGDTHTCASCDTACGGYTWTGVPHNSASTRDSCVHDGGKLVCFSDLGFEITSHTGHGAPPIRDISFPLNNRPGEFYQRSVADARILTFTGQLCGRTLRELECEVFGLQDIIFPDLSPCSCCGKFLLVYHHEQCDDNACNPERDLAICVTYISGLEGIRTNLYNQQIALQFKAHDPFWFEWPGHSSAGLSFADVVRTPNLVQFHADGTATGIPVGIGNTYTSIACRPGTNSFAIGGDFTSINGDPDRCEENLAIWDCNEWVDLCLGLPGGQVHQLTSDAQGNILVAGSFGAPCAFVAIVYEDGTIGCFSGYPGGEAYAIAAPFWAQVLVGDDNGIYYQNFDGNWTTFATNGRVTNFTVDNAGNIYAVGNFTTVDGIETGNIAFLDVNTTGCLDIANAEWSGIGSTFNGTVTSVTVDKNTGAIYIGGDFTTVTPNPLDICVVSNGVQFDSNGSNQQVQMRQIAGDNYQLELYYANVIARDTAITCFTGNNYFRVTGQSSFGTNYNFLFGRHNATFNSAATVVVGPDTFYTIIIDVDISASIGDPCETLNESIVNELELSSSTLEGWSTLPLPGGTGIDNTLSRLSAQCVFIQEQFQGEDVTVNYVAEYRGNNIQPMGNGLPAPVNVLAVHPLTGEVWAGTEQGLYIWNDLEWLDWSGRLGNSDTTEVLDIKFCNEGCEILILFDSARASLVPGVSQVHYNGNVQPAEMNLIVQGPGRVESFVHNGSKNGMRLCTVLECNEIANLNFVNGNYNSNFRDNLSPSILGGSRYDICLDSCKPNNISMLITDDDAETSATLLWRESFMGIEALCCKGASSSTAVTSNIEDLTCSNTENLEQHRDPTEQDCETTGLTAGDLWFNALSGCGLYIFTGDCDVECEEFEGGFVDDGNNYLTVDGEPICPDDVECEDL